MNKFLLQFINENFTNYKDALDLGCGKGIEINYLREHGWYVLGVDLPRVDLNFPYSADREFDLVYSLSVLQFIKNKYVFIDTCYNNLKKGGRLFLLTFHKDDKNFKTELFTENDLNILLKEKFKDVKIERFDIKDNHPPIGEHNHAILIATAIKS